MEERHTHTHTYCMKHCCQRLIVRFPLRITFKRHVSNYNNTDKIQVRSPFRKFEVRLVIERGNSRLARVIL